MKLVPSILNHSIKYPFFQIIVSLAIIAVTFAAPADQSTSEPIPIVKYENEGVNADGSYQWR